VSLYSKFVNENVAGIDGSLTSKFVSHPQDDEIQQIYWNHKYGYIIIKPQSSDAVTMNKSEQSRKNGDCMEYRQDN